MKEKIKSQNTCNDGSILFMLFMERLRNLHRFILASQGKIKHFNANESYMLYLLVFIILFAVCS